MNVHKEERRAAIRAEDEMADNTILTGRIKGLRLAIRHGEKQLPQDLFWFEIMGGCGCGSSDELAEDAWRVFYAFRYQCDWRKHISEETSLELLAHWMGSLGLTEHGGLIAFSWLTPLGDKVWNILQEVDE